MREPYPLQARLRAVRSRAYDPRSMSVLLASADLLKQPLATAEFLAVAGGINRFPTGDQLASAAGLAPVLQQSGKVHYLRRATGGDKTLKRIFYQSAFCALQRDPASRAFYDRKRAEGKRHHQALIALARRRINVLHAILRTRQPYRVDHAAAA